MFRPTNVASECIYWFCACEPSKSALSVRLLCRQELTEADPRRAEGARAPKAPIIFTNIILHRRVGYCFTNLRTLR